MEETGAPEISETDPRGAIFNLEATDPLAISTTIRAARDGLGNRERAAPTIEVVSETAMEAVAGLGEGTAVVAVEAGEATVKKTRAEGAGAATRQPPKQMTLPLGVTTTASQRTTRRRPLGVLQPLLQRQQQLPLGVQTPLPQSRLLLPGDRHLPSLLHPIRPLNSRENPKSLQSHPDGEMGKKRSAGRARKNTALKTQGALTATTGEEVALGIGEQVAGATRVTGEIEAGEVGEGTGTTKDRIEVPPETEDSLAAAGAAQTKGANQILGAEVKQLQQKPPLGEILEASLQLQDGVRLQLQLTRPRLRLGARQLRPLLKSHPKNKRSQVAGARPRPRTSPASGTRPVLREAGGANRLPTNRSRKPC